MKQYLITKVITMITVRVKSLTQKDVTEMHKVLSLAQNQLCIDSGGDCSNCCYKHICDNFMYCLKYLKNAKGGK